MRARKKLARIVQIYECWNFVLRIQPDFGLAWPAYFGSEPLKPMRLSALLLTSLKICHVAKLPEYLLSATQIATYLS